MCVMAGQGAVQEAAVSKPLIPYTVDGAQRSRSEQAEGLVEGGEKGAPAPQAKSSLCSSCKALWHTGHSEGSKGWVVQELAAASPAASAKLLSQPPPFSSHCCRKSWPGTEMEATAARAAATAFSGQQCAVLKTPVKLLLSC